MVDFVGCQTSILFLIAIYYSEPTKYKLKFEGSFHIFHAEYDKKNLL